MPPPSQRLNDKALLWSRNDYDEHGNPTIAAHGWVEIKCNWTDSYEESGDAYSDEVKIVATVTVDRRIPTGSLLWHGSEDDWLGTGSTDEDQELVQVVGYEEMKSVKGRDPLRSVSLVRYGSTIPGW